MTLIMLKLVGAGLDLFATSPHIFTGGKIMVTLRFIFGCTISAGSLVWRRMRGVSFGKRQRF
jgi:hypothetical protein